MQLDAVYACVPSQKESDKDGDDGFAISDVTGRARARARDKQLGLPSRTCLMRSHVSPPRIQSPNQSSCLGTYIAERSPTALPSIFIFDYYFDLIRSDYVTYVIIRRQCLIL